MSQRAIEDFMGFRGKPNAFTSDTGYNQGSSSQHVDTFSSLRLKREWDDINDYQMTNHSENFNTSYQTKRMSTAKNRAPLAERVRPKSLDDFVGQENLLGQGAILRTLIEQDRVPSLIFWGPPGTGKTTLARIIAHHTHAQIHEMTAVSNSTTDVKKIFEEAQRTKRRTLLFLDEIHRFNRAQQDVLLPWVERGTVTLVGATTENPSFKLTSALLSRCRVFVLEKLDTSAVETILKRAITVWREDNGIIIRNEIEESEGEAEMGSRSNAMLVAVARALEEEEALKWLSVMSDGDARTALNALEMALTSLASTENSRLSNESVRKAFQKTHLLYDQSGEEHYNLISALHKSMRGGDADAALYWLTRMLMGGEDPLYIARRLIRFASEDVGLADNFALTLANSTFQACHQIGMPECDVVLAHCVVYLSQTKKSVRIYKALARAKEAVASCPSLPVPIYLRNAPTKLMKDLGYGSEYIYPPDHGYQPKLQEYLPEGLAVRKFLDVEEEKEEHHQV
ncbi:uncharacterized protein VTP21DRAFT_1242 [Calcarisporiella thermophila]|uniref:uncharacterized protein n=1 Tax=Calcarisporiella thermophila TaxID=911321 RepID=UPI003741F1E6